MPDHEPHVQSRAFALVAFQKLSRIEDNNISILTLYKHNHCLNLSILRYYIKSLIIEESITECYLLS